ncbi:Uncharacterised protein [Vibrio cholerae]|uniref:Uncharacterized protein n=1 Tax=Vibrio cholerae TaxID=666 RepID=A0A655V3Q7_VIBCL|nr:Uncharacterised protein [Vibrio cholerae]CSB12698.1 Uncharacterised protein [Vibrio cholerae]CSB61533.1 Uncharacterised protein [Vibrio cholerae]
MLSLARRAEEARLLSSSNSEFQFVELRAFVQQPEIEIHYTPTNNHIRIKLLKPCNERFE